MKDKIQIVNFESYIAPEIIVNKENGVVLYGRNNSFFDDIKDSVIDSPIQNTLNGSISTLIYGNGLKSEKQDELNKILDKNSIRAITLDFKTFGNSAAQVIYKNGVVFKIKHFPVSKLAVGEVKKGEILTYVYKEDWSDSQDEGEVIPAFGTTNGKRSEILYIKDYNINNFYYGIPDWYSAINYVNLDGELAEYHLNTMNSGFSANLIIQVPAKPETEEEMYDIKNEIEQKWTGSNGSKVIIMFSDDIDTMPKIEHIPIVDYHSSMEYITSAIEDKLLLANRVTSRTLVGLEQPSGFSNTGDELLMASLHFDKTVLNGFREILIDHFNLVIGDRFDDLYFESLYTREQEDKIIE